MFNGSGKEAAWIYIDSEYDGEDEIDSFLIIKDNGVWQAIDVQLTRVLGYANDVVLESDTVDVDEDVVNIIEVFYCVRLKAKEKKGVLKSAKLTSVAGTLYVFEDNDNECYGNLTLTGKLVNASKVPENLKSLVPQPPP